MVSNSKFTRQTKTSTRKAAERTFTFFLVALMAHAIYGFATEFNLNASFYICMAGVIFFFINDALLSRSAKSGKSIMQ